jgi:hypothetical protein
MKQKKGKDYKMTRQSTDEDRKMRKKLFIQRGGTINET